MAALVVMTVIAPLVLLPPDREDYLAIIGTKMARLENTPSPKIVFVGGSNLAFGLDSRLVEEQLGYHVVNMGLGHNMGLHLMLDLVAPRIHTGDIVVLVPEYSFFYGGLEGDELLLNVLEIYPAGFRYVRSPRQIREIAAHVPLYARFKITRFLKRWGKKPDPRCVYCPRAFNEYGDTVAHLDKHSQDVAHMVDFLNASGEVDIEAIEVINAFAHQVEMQGARSVFMFPCIPGPHYELRREAIERLHAQILAHLHMSLFSTPAASTYPVEYFYDWVYHLNRQGRTVRTERMIEDLRPLAATARRSSDRTVDLRG
jgi:hypothetical protein